MSGFLYEFPHEVRQCAEPIINASVDIYFRMSTDLLPTPAKSHYVFNLRDLSKCIQGTTALTSPKHRQSIHTSQLNSKQTSN